MVRGVRIAALRQLRRHYSKSSKGQVSSAAEAGPLLESLLCQLSRHLHRAMQELSAAFVLIISKISCSRLPRLHCAGYCSVHRLLETGSSGLQGNPTGKAFSQDPVSTHPSLIKKPDAPPASSSKPTQGNSIEPPGADSLAKSRSSEHASADTSGDCMPRPYTQPVLGLQ